MHTIYILSLHCVLAFFARSAPLPEWAGRLMENPEFDKAVKHSRSLVCKILYDIPEVHKSSSGAFSLDSLTQEQQYMATALDIPPSPSLLVCAESKKELCLNRMYQGLQLYYDLLSTIRSRVSSPEKVSNLLADISDLLAQVLKMRELAQLEEEVPRGGSALSERLATEYEVQKAASIVLSQLQSFSQHVFRSLRVIDRVKKCPLHDRLIAP